MGALTNLTASNGEATPVAHTFVPLGPDAKGVQWFEQVTPTPVNGQAAIRVSAYLRRAVKQGPGRQQLNGIARLEFAIWLPTMETLASNDAGITPPPTVAYEQHARITYLLPERGTQQERKNLRALTSNIINGNSIIVEMIEKLQPLF
jgi:hypothetical protein